MSWYHSSVTAELVYVADSKASTVQQRTCCPDQHQPSGSAVLLQLFRDHPLPKAQVFFFLRPLSDLRTINWLGKIQPKF